MDNKSDLLCFRRAAREAADRVALVASSQAYSFAQLLPQVERAIFHLASHPAGMLYELCPRGDLESSLQIYALLTLGMPFYVVHPRMPEAEVVELRKRVTRRAQMGPMPEGTLALLFTSGTSGRKKGVVLSRKAFLAAASASEANLGWDQDDRWLLSIPLAHIGGLSILTRTLIGRSTMVLVDSAAGHFEATEIAGQIQRDRVSLLSLVPTQLERLLRLRPAFVPPPSLRAIVLGGAAASPNLLQKAASLGVPVLCTYGLTEACSQVATQRYRSGAVRSDRQNGSCGPPVLGMEVRIDKEEIWIRGDSLLSGYLDEEQVALSEDGWFPTGDFGYLDEAGELHVQCRRTDLIVSGGENVYPAEVEQVLLGLPYVRAACVFGIPDEEWGQVVAAAVVWQDGAMAEPERLAELRAYTRERLAPHQRPRQIVNLPGLVENALGKLDRNKTRELAMQSLGGLR